MPNNPLCDNEEYCAPKWYDPISGEIHSYSEWIDLIGQYDADDAIFNGEFEELIFNPENGEWESWC